MSEMRYVRVGKSGLKVSQIILGCMSFGDKNWQPWLLNKDEALPILKYAFDKGINTWDVADTYSNRESERILGEIIKHYNVPRFKLVISKCFQFVDEDKGPIDPATLTSNDSPRFNRIGLFRKCILDAIHRMDRDVAPEEIKKAPNDVVESGKVRYIGASSNRCSRAEVSLPKLLFRGEDQNTDRALVDRVEEFAQRKGVDMAQIAESWLIAKGCMPICGLESEERIDQAVGVLQVKLSDEMKYLEDLYVPKVSFPF
ncbi:hypothetical protein J7337_006088 [Fusarium musae]|uniref:NADP-dependent oxidoreductase domain-containing protein n=1 Tax=Fusarium musae TaxID=1042133 RepID=A0A9P8DJQ6_9HYPO|nr:hypothetical protein J7337_006088 [Fusarium musae]KAG9503245.1 hypothetical protein J7337_006088 [Fusarium musae]